MGKTNISDYRFSIFINNDQAKKSLIEMENVMRGYEAELQQLVCENKRDSAEYREKKKILDEHKAKMVALRKEAGLQALSLKELRALRASLYNEMARSIPGSEHRSRLEREFNAVNKRIREVEIGARATRSTFGKMADGFNKYFGIVTALAASLTGLVFSFRKVIDVANQFEKRVDNLSALTGLAGKELDYLSDRAKELSVGLVEGSVRITQSADSIVDAYTKVGSARPELLKNKEELAQVTQEAMVLAAAANGELQPAVEALTGVMNQFNVPVSEARRIINALAAGSKEGAGEIPYLTTAIEKSGTVAADAGMSIEELIGTIETLAPRVSQPEIAGRSLRGVILRLQKTTDDTNPAIVGFATALENLSRKQLSVNKLMEIFGMENITTAKILLNNIDELKNYTSAVTGTNVAIEQATINTDNNASKLEQARNRVQLLSIELGQKLAPALTFSTNGFSYLMKAILATMKYFPLIIEKYRVQLIIVTGATLAWVAAKTRSIQVGLLQNLMLKQGIGLKIKDQIVMSVMIAKEELLTIWKGKGTIATKLATTAQYAWNTAIKANPIGVIILGITALVAAIKIYDKYNAETLRLEKIKVSTRDRLNKVNSVLSQNYSTLNDQIRDLNRLSVQEKMDLQDKIDKNIKLAESELMVMEARQKKIQADNSRPTMLQQGVNFLIAGGSPLAASSMNLADGLKNGQEAAAEFDESIQTLRDNLKALKEQGRDLNDILNAEKIADEIKGKSQGELEEKLRNYQVALKNTVAGSKDYLRVQEKIRDVNKELAKFSDNLSDEQKKEKIKTDYEKLNDQLKEYLELLQKQVLTDPQQAEITAKKIERIKNYKKYLDDAIQSLLLQASLENAPVGRISSKGIPSAAAPLPEPGKAQPIFNENWENVSEVGKPTETQIWTAKADEFLGYMDTVLSGLMSIDQALTAYENAQMAKDEKVNEEKKKNLKRQLDGKIISQKKYDEEIGKLDADMDAKKRKLAHDQAVRQKEISLIQAIINVAQGITAALSMAPPASYIMAALTGILGAIQIGFIAATPIPEAAKGRYKAIQAAMGRYDVIGESDGKFYPGVPYDPKFGTGIPGRPILVNETGNEIIIDPDTTRNLIMNYPEVINAINMARIPQRATGAYIESSYGPGSGEPMPKEIVLKYESDPRFIDLMERLEYRLSQPSTAFVDWDHFEEQKEKIDGVRSLAKK